MGIENLIVKNNEFIFCVNSILQILRITVAEQNEFIFESVLKINFYTGITVKTYSNLQILLRFIQFAHNRRRESNVFFRIQCQLKTWSFYNRLFLLRAHITAKIK